MPLTEEHVRDIVQTYIRAWVTQDPDLIVTIFAEKATYHERVLDDPIRSRDGIRRYWQQKVVESQARISCKLLNLYLDTKEGTAIVEWDAEFDDLADRVRKRMREVAILAFEERSDGRPLIASLREYWASKPIENLPLPQTGEGTPHPQR